MNAEAAEHYSDPRTHLGRLIAYAWQLGGRPSDWTSEEQRERWHDTYGRLRAGRTCSASAPTSPPSPAATPPRTKPYAPPDGNGAAPAATTGGTAADDDQADDTETTLIVADLHLAGIGWNTTTADAHLAAVAAARARAYRALVREEHTRA